MWELRYFKGKNHESCENGSEIQGASVELASLCSFISHPKPPEIKREIAALNLSLVAVVSVTFCLAFLTLCTSHTLEFPK